MKRYMVVFGYLLLSLILILILRSSSKTKTISQQVKEANIIEDSILYVEEIDGMVLVFTENNYGLTASLLKKNQEDFGFEGIGQTVSFENDIGFDWVYENLNKDNFMIVYGTLTNPEVEKIVLKNMNKIAKIIDVKGHKRIWYVLFSNEEEASRFLYDINENVLGLSKKGDIIYKGKNKIQGDNIKEAEETNYIVPFEISNVTSVSIHEGKQRTLIRQKLSKQDKELILQAVGLITDKTISTDDYPKESNENDIYIRFNLKEKYYEYRYIYDKNIIIIDGAGYYPFIDVYCIINKIVEPDSVLADIERLLMEAYNESSKNNVEIDDDISYKTERLNIDGKGYEMWIEELKKYEKAKFVPFTELYDHKKLGYLEIYSEGIVKKDLNIIFINDKFKTQDGVAVGMTKNEVIERLGNPNYKSTIKWSYKTGDYNTFHLIFEEEKIKYIMITNPY